MPGSGSTREADNLIAPDRLVRDAVRDLPRYKTGVSPSLLKALASGKTVARLASNESAHGPSPRVYEAIRALDQLHLYPDGSNTIVRSALAAHYGIDAERFVVSTGSEDVLRAVFQCVLGPGDRVVSVTPTFLLTPILTGASGAEHVRVPYDDDLEFSAEALGNAVQEGAKLLYISNPNNPTGNAFSPEQLHSIVSRTSPETLVVVDEAYYEYAERHEGYESSIPVLEACDRPHVVLRTFSKAYGLAVRTGASSGTATDIPRSPIPSMGTWPSPACPTAVAPTSSQPLVVGLPPPSSWGISTWPT